MKPFNEDKNIANADDYVGYATDLFETFLSMFTKENGGLRDITEDDYADPEEFNFLYSDKAWRLGCEMKRRLIEVGEAHFPGDEIEIETHLFREA